MLADPSDLSSVKIHEVPFKFSTSSRCIFIFLAFVAGIAVYDLLRKLCNPTVRLLQR